MGVVSEHLILVLGLCYINASLHECACELEASSSSILNG